MKNKRFDCLKWVREIRDQNHEKFKDLSMLEFARELSKEAQSSDLAKKFAQKETNLHSREKPMHL